VETGVQEICNHLKKLDSGFRRNDRKILFQASYEIINLEEERVKGRACQELSSRRPNRSHWRDYIFEADL
jgi:hypothetical protein